MKIHLRNLLLGLMAGIVILLGTITSARAFVALNVGIAPPPLPVYAYDQPACPGDGYEWTPGYWAWDEDANQYYWVPGQWVIAPEIGYLWTPAWWGWADDGYCFHPGYWGRHVGFYGGIAYGHGYNGRGYDGGYWGGGRFYYNRNANNVGRVDSAHVFSRAVAENHDRVSFNGGRGGVAASPTAADARASRESHFGATTAQATHVRAASGNTSGRFAANHVAGVPTTGTHASTFRAANTTGVTHHDLRFSSAVSPATHNGFATEQRFTGANVESRHVAAERNPAAMQDRTFRSESHAAVSRPHFNESRAPAFHAQSFHTQSFHAQSFHAQSFHAASAHVGGGGGGGHGGGGGGHGGHR